VANPSGMTINSVTGVVSWASPTTVGSPHTVTIRATNSAGSDDETWLLTVNPIPPVISEIGNQTISEGSPYTGPTPSLTQGTLPVTWSLIANPSGMTINSTTGVVSWASPTTVGSPHTVTIRATNSAGFDDETWLLTVNPILPVISEIGNQTISEGSPYTGPTPSLTQGTLPVTWSLVASPSGMTINSATGVVSWTSPTTSGSPHTVTIRATNSAGFDDETWLLTVNPVPPIISPISDHSTEEGSPYTGPTPALTQGTLPVTWSLVANPSGMTINSVTGVVSWASPTTVGSPHTVTIRATNSAGFGDETWQLTVNPVPQPSRRRGQLVSD
ncbi:MAG: putative Ig domain-containing protein, partial [Acidobacteria bacterium]|nr:putative Ig domain-containing protein [Acidobacteriota bacterium]